VSVLRCQLHETTDPPHLVPVDEVVGVVLAVNGRPAPERGLIPAALECVERAGIRPERVVDWDPAKAWPAGGAR
jgi:hypothetical protein